MLVLVLSLLSTAVSGGLRQSQAAPLLVTHCILHLSQAAIHIASYCILLHRFTPMPYPVSPINPSGNASFNSCFLITSHMHEYKEIVLNEDKFRQNLFQTGTGSSDPYSACFTCLEPSPVSRACIFFFFSSVSQLETWCYLNFISVVTKTRL